LHHLEELRSTGPKFVKILQSLIENADLTETENDVQANPSTSKTRKDRNHG
jgi:hypothetical protein